MVSQSKRQVDVDEVQLSTVKYLYYCTLPRLMTIGASPLVRWCCAVHVYMWSFSVQLSTYQTFECGRSRKEEQKGIGTWLM